VNGRLTKGRREFYLMAKYADSKVTFKILDARLLVRHIEPNDTILVAHNTTLSAGGLAKYHLSRIEVKTSTFASGSQSRSIDNAVLGTLPKRTLFTLVKNSDILASLDKNPYNFRHYSIRDFVLYVNGTQIPSEGLRIYTGHEITTVMGYRTHFEASGIRHSNAGLKITHMFGLTPDHGASECHNSHTKNGNIMIEAEFLKPLPDAVTCLLYMEYDNCVSIDKNRAVTADFS
jgi:hypothetical protein